MDNNIRNFYEEEAGYERNTQLIREIISKVLSIDLLKLEEKIKYVDKSNEYIEYIDLLNSVIGNPTNKYYYCNNHDHVKYYNLELDKVYKVENLNNELIKLNAEAKVLELKARVILSNVLLKLTHDLKEIFKNNIKKSTGDLFTLENRVILESDIEIFESIIQYLDVMHDETGRLKILIEEKEIYETLKRREKYNKKSAFGKFMHNIVYKEKI